MENHLLASGGVFGQPLKASVRSTSSEQLINFYPSSFETGLCYFSVYSLFSSILLISIYTYIPKLNQIEFLNEPIF